jgi:hypothetical protein
MFQNKLTRPQFDSLLRPTGLGSNLKSLADRHLGESGLAPDQVRDLVDFSQTAK